MDNRIKVTINPYSKSNARCSVWEIEKDEPQRVSIEANGISYSIVFDQEPYIEMWGMDKNGEICKLIRKVPLCCMKEIDEDLLESLKLK